MIGDDLAIYYEQNVDELKRAVNMFVGNLPKKAPIRSVLITDTGGAEPEQHYNISHPTAQVLVTGSAGKSQGIGAKKMGYKATMDLALKLYDLVRSKRNLTIGNADAMIAAALQSPQMLPLDERRMWQAVFNVRFKIRGTEGE